jgi:hypothetical protein
MRRVLLVTTAGDLAADLIIVSLERRGIPFVRFNQEDFPERVTIAWPGDGRCGTLAISGESATCSEFRSAWFRYPAGPSLRVREDQRTAEFIARECSGFLTGFWETAPWFWMNRPSAVALAGSKLRQLAQARAFGFPVPETLITNCPKAAREFIGGRDGIAKTVVNGGLTEGGCRYAIYTTPIGCDDLDDGAVRAAPVIFQERIANDFDLRVTVVGTRVFGTRIVVRDRDGEADWRAVDPSRLIHERYCLPSALEEDCIALVKAFSLSFAALDFIVTPEGKHVFLELNPSGQWGWLEEATQAPITDAIIDHLIEGTP